MPKHNFVHLHVHSDYSLLDGACRISQIIDTAKNFKMPAVALTDHGNLFGAIEFYSSTLKKGLRPVVGYEAYIAAGKRTERDAKRSSEQQQYFHLTLLARNEKGYKNLIKLASIAYREGFYYKPRIDKECLAQHNEGLIGLSGCLNSEVARLITSNRADEAAKAANLYRDILGKENFYLELQDNGIADQKKVVAACVEIGKKHALPLVATNDVHYIHREDARSHDILMAISENKLITDTNRKRMATNEFYFKSAEEMAALFAELPEAISNTLAVADRCNLEINLEAKHLPNFEPPDGKTPNQYLKELVEVGLKLRYPNPTAEVFSRLNFELKTIAEMGFASYFLIVWDFVNFAKTRNIPVGPGRGSAAGSVVSYCLGITNIDPFKYDLLFERFLNPGRHEFPDIDIDFCQIGREEVINYVRQRYGSNNVCQVGTFGKLKTRGLIRDVGRVLGVPLTEVDFIAKKIPADPGTVLKKALESDVELQTKYRSEPKVRELFDIAMKLEGLSRHATKHAAGVVIADKPLTDYTPVYVSDEEEKTQYPAESLQSLGLLKMDFLGLQTLTVIDQTLKLLGRTRPATAGQLRAEDIPLDDRKTYEMLANGETAGVFQMESAGYRELCQKIKPDKFEDVIALLALYRPGVLQGGLVETFIRRKLGQEEIIYIHPVLEPILKETYGVIIYQEQVMKIASVLGEFSPSDADALRKAMGKKKPELLESYREQFITGAAKNKKLKAGVAEEIFSLMEYFGGYGFNKSHSAGYAVLCIRTAYLKANYTVEYMCALLSLESGDTDKIVQYVDECVRLGIKVLPPDINSSSSNFTIDSGGIRFGLKAIKGIGDKAIDAIVGARERLGGRFKSFFQFCEEVDLHAVDRRVIEALIKCGAFDSAGARRSQLAAIMASTLESAQKIQQDKKSGQQFLFTQNQSGAASDRMYPELPEIDEWPEENLLASEKETLGFYITSHPLAKYETLLRTFSTTSTAKLTQLKDGEDVIMGGIITKKEEKIIRNGTRKGQKWAKMRFKDLDGSCSVIAFTNEFIKYADLLGDKVVFIFGKVDFRTEEPTVKISDVVPADKAIENMTGSVAITLKSALLTEDKMNNIKNLFVAHPGSCPVFIQLISQSNTRTIIKTGNDYFVTPSPEFLARLEELLGKGSFRLVRKNYGNQNAYRG